MTWMAEAGSSNNLVKKWSGIFVVLLFLTLLLMPCQHAFAQVDNKNALAIFDVAKTGFYTAPVTSLSSFINSDEKIFKDECGIKNNLGKPVIYPDPVSDYLLVMTGTVADITKVSLVSLAGVVLINDTILPGSNSLIFDVKELPRGTYVIVFENKTDKKVEKIIKM